MSHISPNGLRRQLVALGYKIIPNKGKIPAIKGWNGEDFPARELGRTDGWDKRFDAPTTGVRVQDGLCVIDIDVDDPLADHLVAEISKIAPNVGLYAPTRFGGGKHKMALFCRTADSFVRVASRRHGGHCVEIFGGARLRNGNCSRQFGIFGPHSFNEDGSVAADYVWDTGPLQLLETPIAELPPLSRAQALEICGAFEAIASKAGWPAEEKPATEHSRAIYDIDDATRFDTDRAGRGLSYAELTEAWEVIGNFRCASSFIVGREGKDTSRCWVFWHDRKCVAVYVYGDETTHFPTTLAPPATVGGAADPDWRERYVNGRARPTLHNARLAILDSLIVCSHDVFHGRMFIGCDDASMAFRGEVTDGRLLALRVFLSDRHGLDFTEKHVRDAVTGLAGENAFDPVCDMLDEAEASWDGVARLDRMAVDYFNCEDSELACRFVRKTMIAAVARARRPGCKFDTILVMESPEGRMKSSAWAVLAGDGNFSDEPIIGKSGREVMEQLRGVWIHENADLAGMKKADVDAVKSFASRQVDRARPAYGHFLIEQPRRSIEVGTTNADRYLLSQTGNRRFWPIKVNRAIDLARLRAARLQLWGEAAAAETAGESLVLDERLWDAAALEQEERRALHPWEPLLVKMTEVPFSGPVSGMGYLGNGVVHQVDDEERVASWVIFEHVIKIPLGQMNLGHSKTLAEIMRRLGWKEGIFKLEGKATRGYVRKVPG